MSRKRFRAEEIVNKLREADVLIAQGRLRPDLLRSDSDRKWHEKSTDAV